MAFSFKAINGKTYTYSNVGQRKGIIAEKGKRLLRWDELMQPIEDGWGIDYEMTNYLMDPCYKAIINSRKLPFKTGRLRESIKLKRVPTGFEIYIDDAPSAAPYQYFLEFGTRISSKHKGFWSNNMVEEVVNTILHVTGGYIIESKGK